MRFTLIDVFDQMTPAVVVPAERSAEPVPVREATGKAVEPGLRYRMYFAAGDRQVNVFYPASGNHLQRQNERHFLVSLDEIPDCRLVQQGICRGFDTALRGRRHQGYAFVFEGFVRIPKTGVYLFRMRGTDGYAIDVGGQNVLTWDGLHGPEERTFALHLADGDYPIQVRYFVDQREPFFSLQWKPPGGSGAFEEIPDSALVHRGGGPTPAARLQVRENGRGRVSVRVPVDRQGCEVDSIQLYCDSMQIATAHEGSLEYDGLLPAGAHRVWARIFHDGNRTVC